MRRDNGVQYWFSWIWGGILPCNVCTLYVCYMHSLHFSMSAGKTNFSNVGVIILDVQKNPWHHKLSIITLCYDRMTTVSHLNRIVVSIDTSTQTHNNVYICVCVCVHINPKYVCTYARVCSTLSLHSGRLAEVSIECSLWPTMMRLILGMVCPCFGVRTNVR